MSWTMTPIKKIGEIFDGPHATPQRLERGEKYFLNISSLEGGQLDLTHSDFVSDEDFAQWTRRVTPRADDFLFSYETRLGDAALMPDGIQACLGRRMALIRPDQRRINPRFLLYTWRSPAFREQLATKSIHGATVDRIPLKELGNWTITLPDMATQQAIGEVLGALDDKIASNRRVIEASESLSDALFSFVARAASGTTPAGTYFDLAYGKALPTVERKDGPVPVYGSGGIVGRHESPLFDGPGVVVGRKGSVGTVYWAEDGAFPIDTTFFIRPHGFPHIFVYLLLKRMRLPLMAADSAVPGLNRIRVLQESVPALSQADAQRLAAQVSPLFTKNHQLEQENTTLTAVRDELLPQLMSGRITVKDAEKRVEEEV